MAHDTLQSILNTGEAILGALTAEDYEAALTLVLDREDLVATLPPEPAPSGRPAGPLGTQLLAQYADLTEAIARHGEALSGALRQSGRARHAAGQYAGAPAPPAPLRAHG